MCLKWYYKVVESTVSKKFLKLLRLVVIFGVFGLMVSGLWLMLNPFSQSDTTVHVLPESACVTVSSNVSDKTVVLRVDDIQAYTWRETSKKMIEEAVERNIPLTLGVIPTGLNDDIELITFLKNHTCQVEFGLHGLTHNSPVGADVPEFGEYSKEEAAQYIAEGRSLLGIITSDPIVTWIPPLNIQSKGTIDALTELGFTHISAEGEGVFDYDAATFIYGSNILVSPNDVVKACRKAFEKSSHCVIMVHPQDFASGLNHSEEKFKNYYISLLDALVQEGVTFARLKDIPL